MTRMSLGLIPKMMLSAKAGGERARAPSGAFVVLRENRLSAAFLSMSRLTRMRCVSQDGNRYAIRLSNAFKLSIGADTTVSNPNEETMKIWRMGVDSFYFCATLMNKKRASRPWFIYHT
jgi:hypothetical protein